VRGPENSQTLLVANSAKTPKIFLGARTPSRDFLLLLGRSQLWEDFNKFCLLLYFATFVPVLVMGHIGRTSLIISGHELCKSQNLSKWGTLARVFLVIQLFMPVLHLDRFLTIVLESPTFSSNSGGERCQRTPVTSPNTNSAKTKNFSRGGTPSRDFFLLLNRS